MNQELEHAKKQLESRLGRQITEDEQNMLKGVYYFGKSFRLKKELKSEPQRIGEILPEVMENIRKRCEQNPDNKAFSHSNIKKAIPEPRTTRLK